MRALKRDEGTSPTAEKDNSVKASAEGYKYHHERANISVNEGNGAFSTRIGDKISVHGAQNKRSLSLTLNAGNKTPLATSKSDERAVEKNSENIIKISPLKYTNQTLIMTVIAQSEYFMCILLGAESNILHHVAYHLDKGAQPSLISKYFCQQIG